MTGFSASTYGAINSKLKQARLNDFDLIVVGGKEAGIGVAAGAAKFGLRVLIVEETNRLGGMTGGGVSQTDVNQNKSAYLIGPFARTEFYEPLANEETVNYVYPAWVRANGVARPSVYDRQVQALIGRYGNITVLYNRQLKSVEMNGLYPKALIFEPSDGSGSPIERFTTTRVADGSYTGDLQRLMGLDRSIGRESSALYGESLAGVLAPGAWTDSQNVDPYVNAGSGTGPVLYPLRVPATTTVGAGDGLVMGFGYRPFLTSGSDKIAYPAPNMATYDPLRYELLGRVMAQDPTYFGNTTLGLTRLFQIYDLSFNGGTPMGPTYITNVDVNSLGPISINNGDTDENLEYVTAGPARRRVIENNVKEKILGLFYWLQTDARVPATLKTAILAYGFSSREWKATGGFPPQFYCREGCRIVGDFVMNQAHITSFANGLTNAIARAYYSIDSPIVQTFLVGGFPRTEGSTLQDLGLEAGAPIPVNVLWPKATQCLGAVFPGNPSVSQVVWRSIRMAPIELQMGYAAGVNVALSLEQGCPVQSIDTNRLNAILDIDGLYNGLVVSADTADGNVGTGTPGAGTRNRGVVTTTGTAPTTGITNRPHTYGPGIRWAVGAVAAKIIQPLVFPGTAPLTVLLTYPASDSGATNATVEISVGGVTTTRTINQRTPGGTPGGAGGFEENLGTFFFRPGPGSGNNMSPDSVKLVVTGHDGTYNFGGLKFAYR